MNALQRRATALETEFAHKQEMAFRAEARRNALMGMWAASILGTTNAELYAESLAKAGVDGDEAVLTQLRRDFSRAGILIMDNELNDKMVAMLRQATAALNAA